MNLINRIEGFYRSHRRQAFIVGGAVVVVLAIGFLISRMGGKNSIQTTNTASVERGTIIGTIDGLGVISAEPSASLTWQTGGIVSAYELMVGDMVEKGDVLLKLDDSSVSAEILQTRTALIDAQIEQEKMLTANSDYAALMQDIHTQELILNNTYSLRQEFYGTDIPDEIVEAAYARYNEARVEVWGLEKAYEAFKSLEDGDPQRTAAYNALQEGIYNQDKQLWILNQIMGIPYEYDDDEEEYDEDFIMHTAEVYFILYDLRKEQLAEARAESERLLDTSDEIAAAQANIQAMQNTVDQASIIAPFSGTVTMINTVAGEKASKGDIALQLDDLSRLTIRLEVSQMVINQVSVGQKAHVTFSAIPNGIYDGEVVEISQAGTSSNEDTVFAVTIALADTDEKVRPGFTAAVSIIIGQAEDALLIPNQCLQYDENGSTYVLVSEGLGQIRHAEVETGVRSDAFSELVSGELEEGDALVIAASDSAPFQIGSGNALQAVRRITGGR